MTKVKVNISIDKQIYEELEKLREQKIGNNVYIEDRSRLYEKFLMLGMQENSKLARKLEVLDRINVEKLNLDKVNLEKLGL